MNEVAFLRQKRCNIPVDLVNFRFHPSRQCLMASCFFEKVFILPLFFEEKRQREGESYQISENGNIKMRSRAGRRRRKTWKKTAPMKPTRRMKGNCLYRARMGTKAKTIVMKMKLRSGR